ncbi:hypothetical protein M405DRAFT_829218 [Rhizopogon salebrosus TDB-379]|nr:hypothetical protein M405DRAFT_829218 [Rhizopogon salebrosus TDB-379]
MGEYGYSGLDQVVGDENEEVNEDKYAFGPEDGEDVTNEFKQDAFASSAHKNQYFPSVPY